MTKPTKDDKARILLSNGGWLIVGGTPHQTAYRIAALADANILLDFVEVRERNISSPHARRVIEARPVWVAPTQVVGVTCVGPNDEWTEVL